jgi:hypothetical protein
MIPIPYAIRHKVTARGSMWRRIHCHWCGTDFAYYFTAVAAASKLSPLWSAGEGAKASALEEAEVDVTRQLQYRAGRVRCPNCHRYQPHMIEAVKQATRYAVGGALFLMIIGVLLVLMQVPMEFGCVSLFVLMLSTLAIFSLTKSQEEDSAAYGGLALIPVALMPLWFVYLLCAYLLKGQWPQFVFLALSILLLAYTVFRLVTQRRIMESADPTESSTTVVKTIAQIEAEAKAKEAGEQRKEQVDLPRWLLE